MELQILLILIIAFIVLGPERMLDTAVEIGKMIRKLRIVWDDLKMQAYIESTNRKALEEETKEIEKEMKELEQELKEEEENEGNRTRPGGNASNGTSERTENKDN